jgi:hypothetical protein
VTCKFRSEPILMRGRNLPTRAFFSVLVILTAGALLPGILTYGQETGSSPAYTFTSYDYPGAIFTEAMGINTVGVVVGAYADASGVTHGFALLPTGKFERLDYPGAISTVLARINDSNQVVGSYVDSNNVSHGFMFVSPNKFTPIDYPGAAQTQAYGINKAQEIVGTWFDSGGNTSGFSLISGNFKDLVYPKSVSTVASDVNSSGEVSGSWGNTGPNEQAHGFLLTGKGTYTDVEYPDAVATLVLGVNDLNEVAGSYIDAANVTHGWAGSPAKKQYVTLDFPGSSSSSLGGLGNNGTFVGGYVGPDGRGYGYCALGGPAVTRVPDGIGEKAMAPPTKGRCPG